MVFELKPRTKLKNLTVRFPGEMLQKLEYIAQKEHWSISDMIRDAADHYLTEYDKLPKPKQAQFNFQSR